MSSATWSEITGRVRRFTHVPALAFAPRAARSEGCVAHARAVAAYLATIEFGLTQDEVARRMGVDRSMVSKAVRAITDRRDDPALDAALDLMAEDLRRRRPRAPANGGELVAA